MDPKLWTMFFLVFATTAIVPGPNVAFSVAQSMHFGFRRAVPAAVGFSLGTGCHALVVLSGVGLLAHEHGAILSVIKWAGIAYLLYLSVKVLTSRSEQQMVEAEETSVTRQIFGAILVSFTNPKGLIASLLIYPAFVNADLPYVPQALILGVTAMLISLVVYAGYMLIAGQAKALFQSRAAMNKLLGAIYIGVAVALAMT